MIPSWIVRTTRNKMHFFARIVFLSLFSVFLCAPLIAAKKQSASKNNTASAAEKSAPAKKSSSKKNSSAKQNTATEKKNSAAKTDTAEKKEAPAADKSQAAAKPAPAAQDGEPAASGGVSLSIPAGASRARSYFSSVSPRILSLMEDGSPRSLKLAASLMHRSAAERYSDKEKILMTDCARIMQRAWPSVAVSWETFRVDSLDPYTVALDSVDQGVYSPRASSGGMNEDFLTLVLPCLVLISDPSGTKYLADADRALTRALEIRSDSMLANYLMGLLRIRQRRYDDALASLSAALAADATRKELLFAKELVYSKQNDYMNVLALGSQLLEAYPQDTTVIKYCCNAYFALGQLDKAEEFAAKVLMVEPDNFSYVLLRAKIFMAKTDFVKASALLDAYARSGAVSRDYYLLRARLQKEWNRNNAAAAETMGRALTSYPDDRKVQLFAAQVASDANISVGGYSALELARKVLAKAPADEDAVRVCLTELMKCSDNEGAYAISSAALKGGNTASWLQFMHVDICLACRRIDEAWSLASSLYEKAPKEELSQKCYLKVLVATGRTDKAARLIASLMPSADSQMKSFLYYERSFLYGDEASVLDSLRQSLTSNPRNSDALYRLYQVYYNKKDWKRAQYYLKQVVALNPVDKSVIAKNAELDNLLKK